ncbi:MAG: hypothetical protein AB7S26_04380 [Sandaracinaceae bacterium]
MRKVMVRYTVEADRAEENVRFVRAVFEELERESPEGIRYATFKLPDGVSFVHLASVETSDGTNPLTATGAFRAFIAQIKDRCVEAPVSTELDLVGQYRVFG